MERKISIENKKVIIENLVNQSRFIVSKNQDEWLSRYEEYSSYGKKWRYISKESFGNTDTDFLAWHFGIDKSYFEKLL